MCFKHRFKFKTNTLSVKRVITGVLFTAYLFGPSFSYATAICSGLFLPIKEVFRDSSTDYHRLASAVIVELAAKMGIEVRTKNHVKDSNGVWFKFYPDEGEAINRFSDTDFTKELKILTLTVSLIGEALGDTNGHNSHVVHKEFGKHFVYSIMSEFDFRKVVNPPATRESVGNLLSPDLKKNWTEVSGNLRQLSRDDVVFSIIKAGGNQNQAIEIWRRIQLIVEVLTLDHEATIENSKQIQTRIRDNKNKAIHDKRKIIAIKSQIKQRFLAAFKANTSFASFEEYKQAILAIPEYRNFVQRFFRTHALNWNARSDKLVSIITQGIKSMDQVGYSTFGREEYSNIRQSVEAENLGMDLKNYDANFPAQYRPVSTFVHDSANSDIPSNSQYGDTLFKISPAKIFKLIAQDEIYLTFTLGDSIRASYKWFGRAIPFEYFPYIAAPFVLQYQQATGSNYCGVIDYVKGVYGVKDQTPNFKNGLHHKMNIAIRNEPVFMDNATGISSDYVEAQIYGIVPIDVVETILIPIEKKPKTEIVDALKTLDVNFKTY